MRAIFVSALVCATTLAAAPGVIAGDFAKEIAEAKAGTRGEAKASWWGFDAKDTTKCLQDAINSGVKKLVVDNTGSEWLVRPITLAGDQEIVFADGVVVRAMPGEFKAPRSYLFSAVHKKNIIIRGEGNAVLMMNKRDYQDQKVYEWSEWRHLINLQSCENVLIKDITLKSSGGDGVYIGRDFSGKGLPASKNITLDNVLCDDNHRQGVSVISAENLLMKNSKFNNTKGVPPQTGVDFEPNLENEILSNCVIENCEFNGNANNGVDLYLVNLTSKSRPVSISFRNCRFEGNKINGIRLTGSLKRDSRQFTGKIEFVDCVVRDSKASSVGIFSQQAGGVDLSFKNCAIEHSSNEPIFEFANESLFEMGGMSFDNVKAVVKGGPARNASFCSFTGYGFTEAKGVIKVSKDGREETFDLVKFARENPTNKDIVEGKIISPELSRLAPASKATAKAMPKELHLRHQASFLQYAEKGSQVPVTIILNRVNQYPMKAKMDVKGPDGKLLESVIVQTPEHKYLLKAAATGAYQFDIDTCLNTVRVVSEAPGQALNTENQTRLFRCGGEFFFNVPAGAKEVKILVNGVPKETVDAELRNADGNTVTVEKKIEGAKMLSHSRQDASRAEVWSVKFTNAVEDYGFKLLAPLSPVVSTCPENILITK